VSQKVVAAYLAWANDQLARISPTGRG